MMEQTDKLTALFQAPPRPSHVRFAQAYLMMAEQAKYRPTAPGDGMGNVNLTEDELNDRDLLLKEAVDYAVQFRNEEDTLAFRIGISNFRTNRAFVFAVEAARNLAGVSDDLAMKLLHMAIDEIEQAKIDARKNG